MQNILDNADIAMQKSLEFLRRDLGTINAGRATPSLLDTVRVDCYGSSTQLARVASVSVLDSLTLLVQVWDKSIVQFVEKAILAANLGFSPLVDGTNIKINIPKLSEERRKDMCKTVKRYGEDRKVAIRNIRKESLDKIKKAKEGFGEDMIKDYEKKIQNLTDKYVKEIDLLVSAKEKAILTA